MCPSTRELTKMWYIHMTEYYSAMGMNEILTFVTAWMDLKVIMLSEISQMEKDKHCLVSFICGI